MKIYIYISSGKLEAWRKKVKITININKPHPLPPYLIIDTSLDEYHVPRIFVSSLASLPRFLVLSLKHSRLVKRPH